MMQVFRNPSYRVIENRKWAYLFSADAADYVRREEPAWRAWLQGLSSKQ